MASVPLIFAAQQAIEGALWLALASEAPSPWVLPLANAFMVFALIVWPLWAPVATALVETNRWRLLAMTILFVLAIALAFRGASGIWTRPYEACVVQNSIFYDNGLPYLPRQFMGYVACACFPFLFSSHRALRIFGALIAAGLVISATLYTYAYVSVWCFFAAAGSVTIYLHFARSGKERTKAVQSYDRGA